MTPRDGNCKSLWQDTSESFAPKPQLSPQLFDVAIAGGGITGITLAFLLQQAGQTCVVMEARNLGFGTTGGTTAHLNTIFDTPYHVIIDNFGKEAAHHIARAAEEAIRFVADNVARYATDGDFRRSFGYIFTQSKEQEKTLEKIVQGCMDVKLPVEYVNHIPLPIPFSRAIRVAGQAQIHPMRYLQALARAYENRGGVIVERCRVEGFNSEGPRVSINTSGGPIIARKLVFATHIPIGVNILHLRCPAYRSYALAVHLDGDYPRDLVYDLHDPYHYYRTQAIDGREYLIVGGADHRTGDKVNTSNAFLGLESHARANFPVKEITHRWSAQYFESADGLPYIGQLPGNAENILVATGFGGNGVTYSQVAALLLRDMILDRPNPLIDVLRPSRLKPVAGFTEFVKHNAEVTRKFVGQWLDTSSLKEFADMAPGEGRVVKYGLDKIAVHKDINGELHAVNPLCTHAKCAVAWNSAEQSWDCPCHGSRFSGDGEVLTAPATRGLEAFSVRRLEHPKETKEKH